MVVAVIRHAKVDLKQDFWQSSTEFDRASEAYDTAPVHPVTVRLPETEFRRKII